ncbi:MAG: VWA domain-containing protein, partial [Phycisphaerae bacterium]|nr:VWA domain-containing protein [Phycisphaerae bacterium]
MFEVTYADDARERGTLFVDGTGELAGRWFFVDRATPPSAGGGFSADTDQVPDASRVTPMPVRPDRRAGHDIAIAVTIDGGGTPIVECTSELHAVERAGTPQRARVTLARQREIPNRDFILRWRLQDDAIETATFAHRDPAGAPDGTDDGFFTLMLAPPARVTPDAIPPRELVFVLDCSGSMKEFPIEKAKSIVTKAVEAMQPEDRFTVVTFNNTSEVLWEDLRPNTPENRAAALAFIDARQGGGGTEMVPAMHRAFALPREDVVMTATDLANLPADGRDVTIHVDGAIMESMLQNGAAPSTADLHVREGLTIRATFRRWTLHGGSILGSAPGRTFIMRGRWITRDGDRHFDVHHAEDAEGAGIPVTPWRCVLFLSDGEVGNDDAVVDVVRAEAGSARLFTVGIGNSPNRSLLAAMAEAGRGQVDFVSLEGDADAAVERFVRRFRSPVLTNITLTVDGGLEIADTVPPLDAIPDLFDESPIVVHGRYTTPGEGSIVVSGTTGAGHFERAVPLTLPEASVEHDVIGTLWARAKVDERLREGDTQAVVGLGTAFDLMTPHTSFVAVERARVIVGGASQLVVVPIEMPAGQSWEGTFGSVAPALAALGRFEAFDGKSLGLQSLPEVQAVQRSSGPIPPALRPSEGDIELLMKMRTQNTSLPADQPVTLFVPMELARSRDTSDHLLAIGGVPDLGDFYNASTPDLPEVVGSTERAFDQRINGQVQARFQWQRGGRGREDVSPESGMVSPERVLAAYENAIQSARKSGNTELEERIKAGRELVRERLRTPARYHRVASEYFDQVAVQLGQQIQSETLTEDEIQSMSIDDVRARLIETSKGAARARKTGHVGLQEEAKVERDRLLNRLRGLPALSKIPKPSSDYFHLNDRLSVAVDDHRTPVLAEELVLLVADAYKDSDREVAQRLVENLVDAYPGVESLEALTATLADDTIAEPARANQIDAARANAQEKLTNLE